VCVPVRVCVCVCVCVRARAPARTSVRGCIAVSMCPSFILRAMVYVVRRTNARTNGTHA